MTLLNRWQRLRLMWPVMRLAWRYLDDGDAWQSVRHDAPLWAFGPGALREFGWYLDGPSMVEVSSVDEICQWLAGCEYVGDPDLFGVDDLWQHPRTFEQLRKGDCEDFALWAWRKLVGLNVDARFVTGECVRVGRDHGAGHAWVQFTENESEYILDPASGGTTSDMVRPIEQYRDVYRPRISVDSDLKGYVYAGMVAWLQEAREKRESRKKPKPEPAA